MGDEQEEPEKKYDNEDKEMESDIGEFSRGPDVENPKPRKKDQKRGDKAGKKGNKVRNQPHDAEVGAVGGRWNAKNVVISVLAFATLAWIGVVMVLMAKKLNAIESHL